MCICFGKCIQCLYLNLQYVFSGRLGGVDVEEPATEMDVWVERTLQELKHILRELEESQRPQMAMNLISGKNVETPSRVALAELRLQRLVLTLSRLQTKMDLDRIRDKIYGQQQEELRASSASAAAAPSPSTTK